MTVPPSIAPDAVELPRSAYTAPAPPAPDVPHALPPVLLVDDEPRVLDALSRVLRRRFDVHTAGSGAAALEAIAAGTAFQVIVSDARMPEMDGITFLTRARVVAPDAIRILLTGHADVQAAADAVNEGQVFRFLQKPCDAETLTGALRAAVEQHRLVTAERVLLEETLNGSIRVLTDVLALVSPAAFARACRLRRTVTDLAVALEAPDRWQIELAAMLSQLGCITLAAETLDRLHQGAPLGEAEQVQVQAIPEVTERLIAHIPRLEPVRLILRHQGTRYDGAGATYRNVRGTALPLGARLLKLAGDADLLEAQHLPVDVVFQTLEGRTGAYDPNALRALRMLRHVATSTTVVREMSLGQVQVGMVFATDVVTAGGLLLIARGQEVTASLSHRIHNYWETIPLQAAPRLIVRVAAT